MHIAESAMLKIGEKNIKCSPPTIGIQSQKCPSISGKYNISTTFP